MQARAENGGASLHSLARNGAEYCAEVDDVLRRGGREASVARASLGRLGASSNSGGGFDTIALAQITDQATVAAERQCQSPAWKIVIAAP